MNADDIALLGFAVGAPIVLIILVIVAGHIKIERERNFMANCLKVSTAIECVEAWEKVDNQ